MRKLFLMASLPMVLALAVMVTGCANQQPGGGQGEPAAGDHEGHDHEGHDHEGHDHEGHDHEDGSSARAGGAGEYDNALAELSSADKQLAEKQKVCPVSGQPLGSMGKPIKVTVKGQEVLLCCAGCETQIKEDPDKYLAKLSQ